MLHQESESSGGRPRHTYWRGFIRISDRGKSVAQCMKCRSLIKNTAVARMSAHRKKCPIDMDDSMGAYEGQWDEQANTQNSQPVKSKKVANKDLNESESTKALGGGRPNHKFWCGYTKVSLNGRTSARCIKCKNLFRNTSSSRMGAHLQKCQLNLYQTICANGDHHLSQEPIIDNEQSLADTKSDLNVMRTFESPHEIDGDDTTGDRNKLKHRYWDGFTRIYENGKTVAQCCKCEQFIRNTAYVRLKAHRKKCQDGGDVSMNEDENKPLESAETEDFHNILSASSSSSSPPEPAIFFDIDKFTSSPLKTEKLTKAEKTKLDTLLAKFFIASSVPFAAIDSKFFKDFCGELQASYIPPSKSHLVGPLLEKLHKEQMDNNATFMHTISSAVLLIDEWKIQGGDITNITVLLHNWGHRVHLESFDISDCDTTLPSVLDETIRRCKDQVNETYKVDIFAVVINTECNNEPLVLNSDLMQSTCNAKIGELLVKDIIKKYCGISTDNRINQPCVPRHNKNKGVGTLDNLYSILSEFKRPHLEKKLCYLGGTKAKLPCDTARSSERDCLSWFRENLSRMKEIAAEVDNQRVSIVKTEINQLLHNDNFIQSVVNLHDLINPVAVLLKNCKKSINSIADASEEWLDLLADASKELHDIASKRCEESNVFNKYALSANFLHPLYRGAQLSREQMTVVENFMHERLDRDGLLSFAEYKKSTGIFELLTAKTTQPDIFWNMAKNQHSSLASFALKILMIPASTAQIKHIVSNASCDLRNQFNSERSKKLLEVYLSLKLNDQCGEIYSNIDGGTDSSDDSL
uniref:BED-type domain-containing protein n=2 Tax=Musca domestica TaxID=7370 RepID=A0A1I8M9F8_MUSDO